MSQVRNLKQLSHSKTATVPVYKDGKHKVRADLALFKGIKICRHAPAILTNYNVVSHLFNPRNKPIVCKQQFIPFTYMCQNIS